MASGSDQLPFHRLLQISNDNYKQQMEDAVSNSVYLLLETIIFNMHLFTLSICDGWH